MYHTTQGYVFFMYLYLLLKSIMFEIVILFIENYVITTNIYVIINSHVHLCIFSFLYVIKIYTIMKIDLVF